MHKPTSARFVIYVGLPYTIFNINIFCSGFMLFLFAQYFWFRLVLITDCTTAG